MKILVKKILTVALVFYCSFSYGQTDILKNGDADHPKFNFNILNFYSANDKQCRLDILIQVPYKNLRFVKEAGKFVTSYELSILVTDSSSEVINRSYNRNLESSDFSTTVSQQTYDLTQKTFNLKPGKYNIELSVTDNDSKKTYKISRPIDIRDFPENRITMSDIMLVAKTKEVDGKKMMIPNVSSNVGNLDDKFQVFFEIYAPDTFKDSINIKYTILNKEKEEVKIDTIAEYIDKKVVPVFLWIDKKEFTFGTYRLLIELNSEKYDAIISKNIIGKDFSVRWQDLPISVNDLDLAIKQTTYIASPEEIDKMESSKNQREKLTNFLLFWKNRKPTLEEYFARVDFANEKFKTHREGWRTDMGMVFIMFGAPDNVDRHPFELGIAPYEVWDYYTINRRFIFTDESGFGEYRLVYPIWDDTIRVN